MPNASPMASSFFCVALADGIHVRVRMPLIDGDELRAESEADDGDIDSFLDMQRMKWRPLFGDGAGGHISGRPNRCQRPFRAFRAPFGPCSKSRLRLGDFHAVKLWRAGGAEVGDAALLAVVGRGGGICQRGKAAGAEGRFESDGISAVSEARTENELLLAGLAGNGLDARRVKRELASSGSRPAMYLKRFV